MCKMKTCDTCINQVYDNIYYGCIRAGAGMCGSNRTSYEEKQQNIGTGGNIYCPHCGKNIDKKEN